MLIINVKAFTSYVRRLQVHVFKKSDKIIYLQVLVEFFYLLGNFKADINSLEWMVDYGRYHSVKITFSNRFGININLRCLDVRLFLYR